MQRRMQRGTWKNRLTLGLGVGIASVALIAGCSDDNGDVDGEDTATTTMTATASATETMTETATQTPTETESPTEAPGEAVTLGIAGGELILSGTATDTIVLAAGDTVTFQNDGDAAIALATDDGTIDEEIEAGATFEFTFEEAGTWTVTVDGVEAGTITVS